MLCCRLIPRSPPQGSSQLRCTQSHQTRGSTIPSTQGVPSPIAKVWIFYFISPKGLRNTALNKN